MTAVAVVPEKPFDLTDPPSEPPPGCLDRQRWRLAYEMFTRHQPEVDASRCICGGVWPCSERARAIRGLLTACLQVGAIKVNLPVGTTSPHTCRWCKAGIAPQPVYGWVHVGSGLLVCDRQPEDGPLACVATPLPAAAPP